MREMHLYVRAALLLVLCLPLSACHQGPPRPLLLGVGMSYAKEVEFLIGTCPGERVVSVELLRMQEGGNEVLWRIKSRGEANERFITLGKTPSGFESIVRFDRAALPPGEIVLAVQTNDIPRTTLTFQTERLAPSVILTRGGASLSDQDFYTKFLESCGMSFNPPSSESSD